MLYCYVEVVADDTPAVEAVLKADTKRVALLEEVHTCMQLSCYNKSLNLFHENNQSYCI